MDVFDLILGWQRSQNSVRTFGQVNRRANRRVHKEWTSIDFVLRLRRRSLRAQSEGLKDIGYCNPKELAAADVFVEKAQIQLTKRARTYYALASVFATISFGFIGAAFWFAFENSPSRLISTLDIRPLDPNADRYKWYVILFFLKTTTLGALAVAAIYFSSSLSRAFFHEGTLLFARRHSIRLGRLYLYAKYGSRHGLDQEHTDSQANKITEAKVENIRLMESFGPSTIEIEDLERAFGWNIEMRTAFKDIRPEKMSSTLYSKALETASDLGKALARVSEKKVRETKE